MRVSNVGLYISFLVITIFVFGQAQSSQGDLNQTLIYVRQISDTQAEYIMQSTLSRQAYLLPSLPNCWRISPKGMYIAESSLDAANLTIRNAYSSEIILQTNWQTNWMACGMEWLTDSIIGFLRSDISNQADFYELTDDGTILPVENLPENPVFPDFPEQLQLSLVPKFVLPSPQSNVFLYEQCIGQIISETDQECPLGVNAVIYDANTGTIIANLERSSPDISGYDTDLQRLVNQPGAAWSPTGRYLAYRTVPESIHQNFNLAIHDLVTNQDIEMDFPNEYVADNISISWSPSVNKFLFWIRGRYGEDESNDNYATTRHPIIFDADLRQFVPSNNPYEFRTDYLGNPVTWAPNGQNLVFMDTNNNLINLDTQTGVTSLVDTNVSKVIAWVSVSSPSTTPTPTSPSNTSTPTVTITETSTPVETFTPIPSATVITVTETSTATATMTPTPAPAAAILFTSERDGNHEIYSMAVDGSNVVRLTNSSGIDFYPTWFPDHSKIAFASTRNGNLDVYTMLPDGSNVTQLTTSGGDDYGAQVSPDGTQMLFVSSRDGNLEIYRMNVDGTNQVNLTNNSVVESIPSWSPDGSKISFASFRDNNMELYTANPDGSNPTRLTNNSAQEYGPSWSPDGTRLAFVSTRDGNMEIYVMNVDGSNLTRLTTNSASDGFAVVGGTAYYGLAWSPDSNQLVFLSDRDGNVELYKMNADGTNPTRLTDASGVDSFPDW